MENMVNVYLYGKKYLVPESLTIMEAMEYAGGKLNSAAAVFYALMEAHTNEQMQQIAEEMSPMLTEYSMYVSLKKSIVT